MKRTILFGALGAVAMVGFASFASQAARQPLFVAGKAAQGILSDASYLALTADRATVSVDLVQADAAQINASADTLQLAVGGTPLQARKLSVTQNPDGTVVWYGNLGKAPSLLDRLSIGAENVVQDDPNNSVTIVRNGGKLTGSIRIDGELYKLRPLKSGGHAIARVDESKMPAEHPNEYAFLPKFDMPTQQTRTTTVSPAATPTTYTIRVLVMATQSAANASGDIVGLTNLAIAESNRGYTNSGVYITLQSAGVYITNYVESSSHNTDLSRFRGTTDGYMDNVHTARNTQAADVAVLIINNPQYCGLASGIGSTAATAFATVHYSCATGYYSFAHEIGHLQSARHDPAADPTTTPYAYGHGYRSPTSLWRTIMAYDCTSGCPRINYWSNPYLTLNGQAMGTTATSNNALVLNNTRATIAAFR
jgi:peptidyl-Asp metalloendopeptidase